MNEERDISGGFDPARHGFGFKNPLGLSPPRAGNSFLRRLDPLVFGNGLCLGMVAAALREFPKNVRNLPEMEPTPELLDEIFALHIRQFYPKAILAVVRDWMANVGGNPDPVPKRLRLPEGGNPSGNPHIMCFGPRANRSFIRCMRRAHAVAPCRVERVSDGTRVYIYDPNYPKSRDRFVFFPGGGGFRYGGFDSKDGWGITLLPLSALGEPST